MIESYSFGSIRINGQLFKKDLIIGESFIQEQWWREKGHELCINDIKATLENHSPEMIVVGTGKFGRLKVLEETKTYLAEKGIQLIAEKTGNAYQTYNALSRSHKVIGFFHLTC